MHPVVLISSGIIVFVVGYALGWTRGAINQWKAHLAHDHPDEIGNPQPMRIHRRDP